MGIQINEQFMEKSMELERCQGNLQFKNKIFVQVDIYKYLGAIVTKDNNVETKVSVLQNIFKSYDISRQAKLAISKKKIGR